MTPTTKANIAFGIGSLMAFYAVGGALGMACDIFILAKGGSVPKEGWAWLLPAVLVGTPLAFFSFRYRKAMRRIASGACPKCGYDMRATPKQCPECGAAARSSG